MEVDRLTSLYITVFATLFAASATALNGFYTISGIIGITCILFYRRTVKTGNKKGLNRTFKVLVPLQRNILFLSLVSLIGFITTVPTSLAISTLFSFSLVMLTHSNIRNQLNKTYEMTFGPVEIGLAAASTLLLSGINVYFGFYGSLLVAGLSIYQLGELLLRSLRTSSRF